MENDSTPTSFADVWKRTSGVDIKSETPISSADESDTLLRRIKMSDANPSPQPEKTPAQPPAGVPGKKKFWQNKRFWTIFGGVAGVLLLLLAAGGVAAFTVFQQAQSIRADMEEAAASGRLAYDSFKRQNLVEIKQHVTDAQGKIQSAQEKYGRLSWVGAFPIAGKYYQDGKHGFEAGIAGTNAALKVVAAIEPHADVLGFTGEGSFTGGTTENRIALILETLGQITPELDKIAADITVMQENLAEIDPNDYPEIFQGRPVRQYVVQAQSGAAAAEAALTDFRPVLEQLPTVAGAKGRKKYLVIFQNDNELRPTGGFMTAYAVVFIENGVVTPEKSDDIYELDKKYRRKPPIPPELGRFLITEKQWNLRDMNIDPNFKTSMTQFYGEYLKVPGEPQNIDGVIAIDTNILEQMVEILGPVEVPGYGTFTAENSPRCDCPQIIYALSEIIDRPTPYIRENRKGILAPMMQSILKKTYDAPRDRWPQLAELVWRGIEGRHVQFFFPDPTLQQAAEAINAAGIIPQMPSNGSDYLTVIDANLAGAKSNLFVETSGEINVLEVGNGTVKKQVELTYRNTHPASNCNLEKGELCLNGLLNDWTRWYVPKGAKLDEVLGLEEGYKINTANPNFDIIEGVFRLSPLNQTKVRVTYTVPYTKEGDYEIHLQKQGGTDAIPYRVVTPAGETEAVLNKDITVTVGQ